MSNCYLLLAFLCLCCVFFFFNGIKNGVSVSQDAPLFPGLQLLHSSSSVDSGFDGIPNSEWTAIRPVLDQAEVEFDDGDDEEHGDFIVEPTEVLNLKLRSAVKDAVRPRDSVLESIERDMNKILTLQARILDRNTRKRNSGSPPYLWPRGPIPMSAPTPESPNSFSFDGQLMATLRSGVSLGSGEYFIDVFIGTPPRHYSLILDTGSDLNWIQCDPCYDCFEQAGPYFDPKKSNSYRNISCHDPRCRLVSSPSPSTPCRANEDQSCPYYYWYGDSSNTTGDFSVDTFVVNLTATNGQPRSVKVENVMFGCGHWNRGLFHGAAGVLGLGRGPLSFASQLQRLYGNSFTYCLADRNSNASSKLVFGENQDLLSQSTLNYTALIGGKDPVDTFYYVEIKSVVVGGEELDIPSEIWKLKQDGSDGGTIIDTGTTLSYFSEPAYKIIKEAFMRKVKDYPVVKDFPLLDPCYNVTGVDLVDLPSLRLVFSDGAVWDFPVENYFISLEPESVICLAMLGTPRSSLSIIGNYQQQNFHILCDTKRSKLGFALTNCAGS